MLVFTRKLGEEIRIGGDITVTVLSVQGGSVRLGITAPPQVPIHRQEVFRRIDAAKPEIRLLIAEDHDLIRDGLRATFEETEIDVIGEATTVTDAVRLATVGGDVMLLDVMMPDGDGLDVLQELHDPELAVVIFSQHERSDFQSRARDLGARGYLTKGARAEELIDAIRKASRGEALWSPQNGADAPG